MGPNVGRGVQKLMDPKTLEPFSFTVGDATTNGVTRLLDEKDYRAAHECVLANCELLRQYEMVFEREIIRRHPRVDVNDVWSNFEHQFIDWFKQYVLSLDHISDDIIRTLAMGPSRVVRVLDHCHIDGCNFDTYAYGKNKSTMNYGVCAKLFNGSEYYGILQEIIELVYHGVTTCYRTILFKCDWMDSGMGINVHEKYKLVEVNHTMKLPRYDPFVLANGVQQVYFTAHPSTKNDRDHWWAVFKIKKRSIIDVVADYEAFQEEVDENPLSLPEVEEDEEDDDDQEEEDGNEDDVPEHEQ